MSWGNGRRPASAVRVLLAASCAIFAAGCSSGSGNPSSTTVGAPTSSAVPLTSTTQNASGTTTQSPPPCTNTSVITQWSPARRAAQLIAIPALDGQVQPLASVIASGVGGVLLIGGAPPADLARQIMTAAGGAHPPPLVMADEEGGGVQRLAGMVGSLPWPRQMAATMSPSAVQAAAQHLGAAMRALGVTMDLAPVLDVDGRPGPDTSNPDGLRSFSADPATAATYGVAFAAGLRQGGVLAVGKHFPGLGGSTANTDNGAAATLPIATLETQALPPFRAAIAAGVPAVMIANATVPGLTTGPASLSAAVMGTLLRGQLGFRGLVMTDSLSAGAIVAAGYSVPRAAVTAIEAGADMILFGSTLTPAERALLTPANVQATTRAIVDALVAAVSGGSLPASRLDAAVLGVLTAKGVSLCPA